MCHAIWTLAYVLVPVPLATVDHHLVSTAVSLQGIVPGAVVQIAHLVSSYKQ